MALTDHDTLAGIRPALAAAADAGVRVIGGCEFSVAARWGEMHLLGYFLPHDRPELDRFLEDQRAKRVERAHAIVDRLNRISVPTDIAAVLAEAGASAVGRPHVARSLVKAGAVRDANEAFNRYLADGKPAFVAKSLPALAHVTALVRAVGGVSAAAHLGSRASKPVLLELRQAGVDAVEVLHPAHGETTSRRIGALAKALSMPATGGSDWHGDSGGQTDRGALGSLRVPESWLDEIEALHLGRLSAESAAT